MQTVLITGGTGLVGKALCNLLLANGYKVIVLTRSIPKNLPMPNLKYALWDVKKQQIDIAALQQADFIVHLAGAGVMDKKWTPEYKAEIVSSRVKSALLIAASLANNSNKVKAVISASAIGFYGEDKEPIIPFTEDAEVDDSFLGDTCKLWEQSIEQVVALNKRLVKVRIGIVLSKDGGALQEFITPLKFGVAAILGNGKQTISWIHIDDLCRLFLFGIENEKLSGVYNGVAPNPVSNKTLTITLAKKLKNFFYIPFYVPTFILKIILGTRSIEILKSATVSCKKIIAEGFTFLYPDIDNALGDITDNYKSE